MKKIYLIRHAKSSWSENNLADIDRPLNNRGIKSCQIMAPEIEKLTNDFDNIYCSPANRAQQTISNIAQNLPHKKITWQTDQTLYTFSSHAIFNWFLNLDNKVNKVMVVGHNPALTDFCNLITGKNIINLATCSFVVIEFNKNSWQDLAPKSAKLNSFIKPKMFMKKDVF